MISPYSLGLYTPLPDGAKRIDTLSELPGVRESWQRGKKWEGGDDVGDFSLHPHTPVTLLRNYFDQWLGYDVQEWATTRSWRGLIYEMEFDDGQVRHTRSLDWLRNKVTGVYDEGIKNGGMELARATSPTNQPAQNWNVYGSDGGGVATITYEATYPATGESALKFSSSDSETVNTLFNAQSVTVEPNTTYEVSFATRGDGTNSQNFAIHDEAGGFGQLINGFTGVTQGDWQRYSIEVVTPAGCTTISVRFYCPSEKVASTYVDDVSVRRKADGRIAKHETAAAEDLASQRRYGVREVYVDAQVGPRTRAEALRDRALALGAWPEARETGKGSGKPGLKVACVGYGKVLEWVYTDYNEILAESQDQVQRVAALIALASDFLTTGLLDVGSTSIDAYDTQRRRQVWQVLTREIMPRLGGWYRLWVDDYNADARPGVHLFEVSNEPSYLLTDGEFYDRGGHPVPARLVEPAIVRNTRQQPQAAPSTSAYLDQRDFTLASVSVNPAGQVGWSVMDVAADIPEPSTPQLAYSPKPQGSGGGGGALQAEDKSL